MTRTIKVLATLTAIFFMSSSFTGQMEFIGTYSVYAEDPAQIKLMIHPDHTFYYQDFSVTDHKIVVTGNWTLQGKKVVLNENAPVGKFHNVWTFEDHGQVAKSRKGFNFYRLTKIDG
jgi:hypothetical protein